MSALDIQVGGDHYKKYKIQPMEYSMANGLDACQHTAIKYVTRFRDKGGIADLEKAKHCIDLLIEFERKATEYPTPEIAAEAAAGLYEIDFPAPTGYRPETRVMPPAPAPSAPIGLSSCLVCGEPGGHFGTGCPKAVPVAHFGTGVKPPPPAPRPAQALVCVHGECLNAPYADSDYCTDHQFDGH